LIPAEVIQNGSLIAALPLALLAGLVSFLSPCVLPLVPGYLAYVSGNAREKNRVVLGASLFVAGFVGFYFGLGALVGSLAVFTHGVIGDIIQRVFGLIVFALGFVMIGQVSWLQRNLKLNYSPGMGLASAPLLGIAFALGWTPCMGPTLAAVLNLSLQSESPWRGAILGLSYGLGLGLPLIAIAAGFGWATRSVSFVKRHIRAFNLGGGILLMILGLLMLTGLWNIFIENIQVVTSGFLPSI
jgi:cytochrome c-type biogenesis protein